MLKILTTVIFTVGSITFANTTDCSNALGTIEYHHWQYMGGAYPPPGMETYRADWFLDGKIEKEAKATFSPVQTVVEDLSNEYEYNVKYLVSVDLFLPPNTSKKDLLLCVRKFSKIPPP